MSNTFRAACAALVLTTLVAAPLCAQTQTPTPAAAAAAATPTAAAPAAKSGADWGVRCAAAASISPCEMVQIVTQNKTGQRVVGLSIAYAPKANRYILQVAVPLGVALSKGMKILANGYNEPPMSFRRCDSAGCYVEGIIDSKNLDALAAVNGPAKIEIAALTGQNVDLPFSLRGFAEARKDMEDRAREKAAPAAAKP